MLCQRDAGGLEGYDSNQEDENRGSHADQFLHDSFRRRAGASRGEGRSRSVDDDRARC
ncbi:hypothetical protein MGWOODY_Smn880 [hydrothermal vent metagenome]|uniref:Uncharacterized protein n=1 Tax=hydrothermal vent metagenome TaxID=652676 RepID=A0A160TQG2_9ZZZZ